MESVKSKVARNKRKELGQAHQGVVDETRCEWMIFKMRKGVTHPKLEPHAGACEDLIKSATLRKMCVRQDVLSAEPRKCLY